VTRVFTDMEIWVEVRRRVLTGKSRIALHQFSFRLSCVGDASTDALKTSSSNGAWQQKAGLGHGVFITPA
jgi:hypothetical protein